MILDYEPIREQLATDYHTVTLPFHDLTGVRVYIAPGRLVRTVTILTRLTVDDTVEVFAIEIDRWPPAAYDED